MYKEEKDEGSGGILFLLHIQDTVDRVVPLEREKKCVRKQDFLTCYTTETIPRKTPDKLGSIETETS